jgi:hypothetical protein
VLAPVQVPRKHAKLAAPEASDAGTPDATAKPLP